MSQSEDYLDGLLNSINKAKTDAVQGQENAQKVQQEIVESRKNIAPEEDFFTATGITSTPKRRKSSHPYLRKVLSEDDFLREFEEEISAEDTDAFIESFEQEIDEEERIFQETGELQTTDSTVDALLDNINAVVDTATNALEEDDTPEEEPESNDVDLSVEDPIEENDSEASLQEDDIDNSDNIDAKVSEDGEVNTLLDEDLSALFENMDEPEVTPIDEDSEDTGAEAEEAEEDDFGFSLDDAIDESGEEEPLDDSLKEFLPDEMDALDAAEYGEGEEPDLSGDGDLDLENLLGDDEDLLDIQSLLNGDEEGAEAGDIDESAEGGDEAEEEDGKDKKKKKKKDKKEKGEKKPNPIISKLLLILFGPPDEDELAEMAAAEAAKNAPPAEITYDEDGNPIVPEGAEEGGKKKKKKEKKEKPPKEKKEKKEKPPKPPKPKKEKKPKEPDNSPKIPISIIATFLVLSISIIGVVVVGMNYMGIQRHTAQARELFENHDYILAYEKLNGLNLTSEEDVLMRNQARTLADVQQCQNKYDAFIQYELYDVALDSLIIGIGRYEEYKEAAIEYGIQEEYDAYGDAFVSELNEQFGLSKEEALAIYNQSNRHYYTVELRKVLIKLGLEEK
ncbi:MAG: hypothetical protein K6E79_06295 [Pseudobutyrivibrio sp.]|nr:hypothetical protein [Pseudobutyrivibrio sp.]